MTPSSADSRLAPAAAAPGPAGADVFIARQPILDSAARVVGYELLFRGAASDPVFCGDGDQATARVITDVMSTFDLDVLTHGRLAFINVTRSMLVGGIPPTLPADRVVLEILEDIEADAEVLDACRSLKQSGYRLALDDFAPSSANLALLPYADFVKAGAIPDDPAWMRAVRQTGRTLSTLAERIETQDDFARAKREGFTHFQGFFFGRPLTQRATTIPDNQLDYLRLMNALGDPTLTNHQLEALIKPHASLCYRALRTANSAASGLRSEIESIGEALLLIGREPVQRWVSIWALAAMAHRSHSELLVMSTLRARFCEQLAARSAAPGEPLHAAGGFLLGLCSMLDAVFAQPMDAIVRHLPLGASLSDALLGADNNWRRLLECVMAYERGDWSAACELALRVGVSASDLGPAHADAVRWANEACRLDAAGQAA
jgi:EAL and modified HD-GYP domain-containing signal transduction protein